MSQSPVTVLRAALQKIADNQMTVFDEDENCEVLVCMGPEDMIEIADAALAATQPERSEEMPGEADVLRAVLEVVRECPVFDDATSPLSEMMDQALAGKVPTLLGSIDSLASGRAPAAPVQHDASELPAVPPDSLSSEYPKEERAAFDKWHMRYGQGFRQWSVYNSAELMAAWAAWYARAALASEANEVSDLRAELAELQANFDQQNDAFFVTSFKLKDAEERLASEAKADATPVVPDGFVLIPVVPNESIRKAMHHAYWQTPHLPYHDNSPKLWNDTYAALVALATSPATVSQDKADAAPCELCGGYRHFKHAGICPRYQGPPATVSNTTEDMTEAEARAALLAMPIEESSALVRGNNTPTGETVYDKLAHQILGNTTAGASIRSAEFDILLDTYVNSEIDSRQETGTWDDAHAAHNALIAHIDARSAIIEHIDARRAPAVGSGAAPDEAAVAWAFPDGVGRLARVREGYADSPLLVVNATCTDGYSMPLFARPAAPDMSGAEPDDRPAPIWPPEIESLKQAPDMSVRDAALEEAAKVCELLTTGPDGEYRLHLTTKSDFRCCAAAIRALSASTGEGAKS